MIALIGAAAGTSETAGAAATPTANPWSAVWREWLDGLHLIGRERVIAVVFAFAAITGTGEGVMSTLLVPFVIRILHGDGFGYGWILAAQAVGGLAGSLAIGRLGTAITPARLLGLGAVGLGGIDLLIFNYYHLVPGVIPAIVLMAIVVSRRRVSASGSSRCCKRRSRTPIAGASSGHTGRPHHWPD